MTTTQESKKIAIFSEGLKSLARANRETPIPNKKQLHKKAMVIMGVKWDHLLKKSLWDKINKGNKL